MDEEELEEIRKQSMAGLFMSFSMAKKKPEDANDAKKKRRRRRTPRSGEISEDSMEDMVSDELDDSNIMHGGGTDAAAAGPGHTRIDTQGRNH